MIVLDEIFVLLIVYIAMVCGIFYIADSKGYNGVICAIVAIVLSPLLVGLFLLLMPKTMEKKVEEKLKMKKLMEEE